MTLRRSAALPPAVLAVFTVLAVLPSPAASQRPPDRPKQLDAFVSRAMRDWGAVGLAVAVVKDGQIVFAKGYGERTVGSGQAVDTQTVFAIGSTTKAMTAAALGMLVDEGKVRWDDPVTKYLPDFALFDPWVTRELTVRDLLTHRAGVGNADFLWYETSLATPEILRRMRLVKPAYSLRAGFIYQNVMYAAAGEVVRAASGMPWAEFVRTRLLTPLEMTRTVTSLDASTHLANVAAPHFRIDDTVRVIRNASVDGVAPAGAIWSSVGDMAKWTRFMLDSGTVNGRHLLQPATWRELLTPQTVVPPAGFYPTAQRTHPHWTTYGLGWFQQDYDGRAVSFHTGSIDGMVAILGMIPDERLGVYVLANLDHVELRHAIMLKVFDLWGPRGAAGRDWSAELRQLYDSLGAKGRAAERAAETQRVTGTSPALAAAAYAGTYADSLYGRVEIVERNGGLELRLSPAMVAPLDHWQYETFHGRWTDRWKGTVAATFTVGADGRPSQVDVDGAVYGRVVR